MLKMESLSFLKYNFVNLIIESCLKFLLLADDIWLRLHSSVSSVAFIDSETFITHGSIVPRNALPIQHVTGNLAIGRERFPAFLKTNRESLEFKGVVLFLFMLKGLLR